MRDSRRVLILTSKLAKHMQKTSHRFSTIPATRLEYLPCNNGHSRRRAAVTEPTDVEIAIWLLGPTTQGSFPSWAFKLCMEGAYPLSVFCEERLRNLLDNHSLANTSSLMTPMPPTTLASTACWESRAEENGEHSRNQFPSSAATKHNRPIS